MWKEGLSSMELKLRDGDYLPDGRGSFETASGIDEILERVLFKLTARRGGFALMPELGSRLYLLGRQKPSERLSAAKQYVLEALADEEDISLLSVDLADGAGETVLTVVFEYEGESVSAEVSI